MPERARARLRVVSVDVGIVHLGLVDAVVEPDGRVAELPLVRLVDLTRLPHRRVSRCDCKLHHSRELADRLEHFFQEYADVFGAADVVLVERQPITGLQAVQQALFRQYRDKVVLLAPTRMHRHFGLCGHYEGRKRETVAIFRAVTERIPHDASCLAAMDRLHDVADAVCLLLYYAASVVRRDHDARAETARTVRAVARAGGGVAGMFDRFRYTGGAAVTPGTFAEREASEIGSSHHQAAPRSPTEPRSAKRGGGDGRAVG